MDAKLQEVLLDYGLEGYGLYWYCIELISAKVAPDNITFELEHDCRIIARNVGSSPQKVQEMMTHFVELGLFENSSGTITCRKIAKRLDKSMTSNSQMRKVIDYIRENHDFIDKSHDPIMTNHDEVMTKSGFIMQEERRGEEKRRDINTCSEPDDSKPPPVITIPTNRFNTKGEEYPVTQNQIDEWQSAYPAVEVLQALKRIRSWNVSNPNKRKTLGGMAKHIDNWLAKEQNNNPKPVRPGTIQSIKPRHKPIEQIQAEQEAELEEIRKREGKL